MVRAHNHIIYNIPTQRNYTHEMLVFRCDCSAYTFFVVVVAIRSFCVLYVTSIMHEPATTKKPLLQPWAGIWLMVHCYPESWITKSKAKTIEMHIVNGKRKREAEIPCSQNNLCSIYLMWCSRIHALCMYHRHWHTHTHARTHKNQCDFYRISMSTVF